VVVTNRRVLKISLSQHVVCVVLRLLVNSNGIVQADRLCKIFELNLPKIHEFAGDIKMTRKLMLPEAITTFKLAKVRYL